MFCIALAAGGGGRDDVQNTDSRDWLGQDGMEPDTAAVCGIGQFRSICSARGYTQVPIHGTTESWSWSDRLADWLTG